MRLLRSLARSLALVIAIELTSSLLVVIQAEEEVDSCLTTSEIMAAKLASLPEGKRIFYELKIPGKPVLGEVRKYNGFIGWTIKEDLDLGGRPPELVPRFKTIEACCVGIIEKEAYVFVEVGVEDEVGIKKIMSSFPGIKKDNTKLLGPPGFDVDGDPAVYIVISKSIFPKNVSNIVSRVYIYNLDITFPGSSCSETIFIRARASIKKDDLKTFLSHEFNHLLVLSYDFYDDIWIYEGLGYLSAYLTGHGPADIKTIYLDAFLNWHKNALVPEWNIYNHISAYQFFRFLYKAYGIEAIRKIARDPCDGEESVAKAVGKPWNKIWLEYEDACRQEGIPIDSPP